MANLEKRIAGVLGGGTARPKRAKKASKKFNVETHNSLERAVKDWVNEQLDAGAEDAYGVLYDVLQGGCASGAVGELVYYSDTIPFYKRHKDEILALAKYQARDFGMSVGQMLEGLRGWDKDDPLAEDTQNQNLLAWYGFEETARDLAGRAGIEI
jgi:hypothetical protein